MFRHMEWFEAADLIVNGMEGAINAKTVTYDFSDFKTGAWCSRFLCFHKNPKLHHISTDQHTMA